MEALFIFFTAGEGHTHQFIDLTPVVSEGASEEDALEWAYEKFGNGRQIDNVRTGTHAELEEALHTVFSYAV